MTAAISFEIEIELTGTVTPGEPMTRDDPGCDPEVDDLDIADIGIITSDNVGGMITWKTTTIMDGVDRNSPAIQRLFTNILSLCHEDAELAVIEDDKW